MEKIKVTSSQLDSILASLKTKKKKTKRVKYKRVENNAVPKIPLLNQYALYNNDNLLMVGTAEELAERENVLVATIYQNVTRGLRRSKWIDKVDMKEYVLNRNVNKIVKLHQMGFSLDWIYKTLGVIK